MSEGRKGITYERSVCDEQSGVECVNVYGRTDGWEQKERKCSGRRGGRSSTAAGALNLVSNKTINMIHGFVTYSIEIMMECVFICMRTLMRDMWWWSVIASM